MADSSDTHLEQLLAPTDDLFLSSLSSEDFLENLAPLVKDSLATNSLNSLLTKLEGIATQKDAELEQLTQDSTEDILAAIEGISLVKANSDTIKDQILEVSSNLERTGYELVARKKSLVQCKAVRARIQETTATLNACLYVLELTNKVLELIRERRYYNALRNLEDLSHVHLREVGDFAFAAKIAQSIPALQQMIQNDSLENVTKWMARVEKMLPAVGGVLFGHMRDVSAHWASACAASPALDNYMVNTPVERALRSVDLSLDLFDPALSLQLDLTVVYDAILVYQTVHQMDFFIDSFQTEWLKKKERVIRPLSLDTNSQVSFEYDELKAYIHKVAAFFAVDRAVTAHTHGKLRTEKDNNDLWGAFMLLCSPMLRAFIDDLDTMDEFHQTRDLLGGFCQVMENCGYNVVASGLYGCLVHLFERYSHALIRIFAHTFAANIDEDDCMPMVIQDPGLYAQVVAVCWYEPPEAELTKRFPRALPFSNILPLSCQQIQTFVLDHTKFIANFYAHDGNVLWGILIDNIEHILSQVICEKYTAKLTSTTREEISQNLINLEFFLHSAKELAEYLSVLKIGGILRDVHLSSIARFVQTKKIAEDSLFGSVDKRIEDFMGIVEYDWFTTVRSDQPNYIINDIGRFVEDMFIQTFSNLPGSVKTLLLFRTFDKLADHFLGFLQDAPEFTPVAIENFDLDVTLLENTINDLDAGTEPPASKKAQKSAVSLSSTFTELRQTINLLREGNLEGYKDSTVRMRKYDRIKQDDAVALLNKLQTEDEEDEVFAREGSMSPRGMSSRKSSSRIASLWGRKKDSQR
ncbi:hypothetical protein BABINDRAFT_161049 [Babjeviella inositovora NRRL Y-12698]|uniref:Exocyst complex component SEC15 n=1 Tax=Babjeviella inositovora NRRL Y-12698 TaxID=984486 RepID=A0A1E3QT07_9ASCO|nr:uncharacterized protein BABINDRAFT_161049 [Babjeviella inositovora NRRL Y-12698]ODQ80846.1 hypothetical protein BABINDRAFT_161049 [Babjeviella inositovora NRRL Y-12698]